MKSAETAIFIAASLLLAAFVLGGFVDTYVLPASQSELLEWVSWILGMGGIIMFLSGILTHKKGH